MRTHLFTKHPCFSKEAEKKYGRIHLPVAPRCNISCNYCSRKYDCVNESRPGVTSKVLMPEEAIERLRRAMKAMPYISTVGIAGPGDSLANPEKTFRTLEMVRNEFPNLHLCLSTNGLMLPDYVGELERLKVGYITVTVNCTDHEIAGKVYRWVRYNGKTYYGAEGANILLERQQEGLSMLNGKNCFIKINTLFIPGVNEGQIPKVAERVNSLGAHLVNVMPLIPAQGSAFESFPPPEQVQIERARASIGEDINLMTHCRQCRSDAVGLLSETGPADVVCKASGRSRC